MEVLKTIILKGPLIGPEILFVLLTGFGHLVR